MVAFARVLGSNVEDINEEVANYSLEELLDVITKTCNGIFKRKENSQHVRKPQYWWNTDIAQKRKLCTSARRAWTRSCSRNLPHNVREPLYNVYARRVLKKKFQNNGMEKPV